MTTPHIHKDAIIAFANGHKIETFHDNKWHILYTMPTFHPKNKYRVYDEFRELKEAQADGLLIQGRTIHGWQTVLNITSFCCQPTDYRVLPQKWIDAYLEFCCGDKDVYINDVLIRQMDDPRRGGSIVPFGEPVIKDKKKHIHADLMLQYAKDAQKTDKPQLLWQYKDMYGVWQDFVYENPSWRVDKEYRRDPRIGIG